MLDATDLDSTEDSVSERSVAGDRGNAIEQNLCKQAWNGVAVSLREVHCTSNYHVELTSDRTRLYVILEQVGGSVAIETSPRPVTSFGSCIKPMNLIPAGMRAWANATQLRYMRYITFQFDHTIVGAMLGAGVELERVFAPRLMFSDLRLLSLSHLFAAECMRTGPANPLYGNGLCVALLTALSNVDSAAEGSQRGALAPWQLRRVIEHMEGNCQRAVSLQMLSGIVRLTPSYFCTAFKVSTGLSPHQWLLEARVRKAQRMLIDHGAPIAEIALEVGFADQAHFTRIFTRTVGISPGVWRRSRMRSPALRTQETWNANGHVV